MPTFPTRSPDHEKDDFRRPRPLRLRPRPGRTVRQAVCHRRKRQQLRDAQGVPPRRDEGGRQEHPQYPQDRPDRARPAHPHGPFRVRARQVPARVRGPSDEPGGLHPLPRRRPVRGEDRAGLETQGLLRAHRRVREEVQEEGRPRQVSAAARPLLEVRHLRVEFNTRRGTLRAIDDVSLAIAPGEVLGVVGESGAGKSITGTAIIGLLEPPGRISAGEVLLDGVRIDNLPAEAMRRIRGRRIGAIFQDPLTSLNPLYTVGRQITETIQTHLPMNAAEARERAIALLKEVGIPAAERRIDHYPHQFSGGMRQRVVIALALCANPELIIADEPTTALDVSIQAQIITLLKTLCREHGTSVMLVTHDMGVIAETADRVAVMYAGRLVEVGPVQDVIHNPQHPYTAGLMGSIPAIGQEVERLPQIEGSMPRLNAIPQGCAFNPRCPKVFDRCRKERPDLLEAGATRAACWLHAKGFVTADEPWSRSAGKQTSEHR
ncbi:MAG: ABC transporter ATP-binding protein [Betaproteobacteria bacterium]|nr:ABC transporter ATP-binding protein [Betaproteobacteria bacterium]